MDIVGGRVQTSCSTKRLVVIIEPCTQLYLSLSTQAFEKSKVLKCSAKYLHTD